MKAFPPFVTAPAGAVTHHGWTLLTDPPVVEPAVLTSWDYLTPVPLNGGVTVDGATVLEHCRLADDSLLQVTVTARNDRTYDRANVLKIPVAPGRNDIPLTVTLSGDTLGGRLTITTRLTVVRPVPLDDTAPQRAGSILWSHDHRITLDGTASRFPVDAEDFTRTRPRFANAPWHLEIDTTNPAAAAGACIRLTINLAHPAHLDLLDPSTGGNGDLHRNLLRWDVSRRLIHSALDVSGDHGDPIGTGPLEDGSLAAVFANHLAGTFGSDTVDTLRRRRETDPSRFETEIMHRARLLQL